MAAPAKARLGRAWTALPNTKRWRYELQRFVSELSLGTPLRLPANFYSGHTPNLEDFKHASCHACAPGTIPAPQDLPTLAVDFIRRFSSLSGVTRNATAVRITSR